MSQDGIIVNVVEHKERTLQYRCIDTGLYCIYCGARRVWDMSCETGSFYDRWDGTIRVCRACLCYQDIHGRIADTGICEVLVALADKELEGGA